MLVFQRHHHVRPGAFTLIELILVMIILCTVLGMAAPSLRGFFSSRKLNDMSEQILIMTRYARTQAITEGINYRINFDPIEQRYWISSLNGSMYERLRNSFGNYHQIPTEIVIDYYDIEKEDNIYYLPFNPQGYSRQSRIRFQDGQDNILEIVCEGPSEKYEIIKIYDNREVYVE